MEISFRTRKLQKTCNSKKDMQKDLGTRNAEQLAQRLNELRAADSLADMRLIPAARCHELKQDRKGQLAVDLAHPKRLVFVPDQDPVPAKDDGGLDWDAGHADHGGRDHRLPLSQEEKAMPRASNGNTRYPYEPDYAVAPGRTLEETINNLGIDQRELASRTGLSAKHVNQIIKGTAPLTQETAIRLERVTGVPARMWNNLEAQYREQIVRIEARDRLERDLEWLRVIPTKEWIARGAIQDAGDQPSLLEEVLRFFGVATVDAWKQGWEAPQFAFRKSLSFKGKAGAMATWLAPVRNRGAESCVQAIRQDEVPRRTADHPKPDG